MSNIEPLSIYDRLLKKIYAYYHTIWREKWQEGIEKEWLDNFENLDEDIQYRERLNMLYLLTKFMYFGNEELRQLLFSLYRDLIRYPIVAKIRRNNANTLDFGFIETEFEKELSLTRFLGVGNPSESGVHMLYYFRQECKLRKEYFINTSDIFSVNKVSENLTDGTVREFLESDVRDAVIERYIFIDDFCGSGSQAKDYLKSVVENLKFKRPETIVNYFMLFGTEYGVNEVKALRVFDEVRAVFTIDESFKTFSENSRYFLSTPDPVIEKNFAHSVALQYGKALFRPPLGYGDCQLLLGLSHNTPDNSLPIFWSERNWKPIFKRYHKIY